MESSLLQACKSGDLEVVKYLVSQGANVTDDNNYAVQDIPYKELQANLLKNKQVLQ